MKLIGTLTSPFVRKVRIVAIEKHIDLEFVVDIPWNPETRVAEFNPLGKVPVLVLDDGATLFDSRVIAEYLDTVTPVSRLIPEGNRQRIAVRRWEALADGVTDSAALIYIERAQRAAEHQSQAWIARQEQSVLRGLEAMSEELGEKKWKREVIRAVTQLKKSLIADYVVLGGGNAKKFNELPDGIEPGHNRNAFLGGVRLWQNDPRTRGPKWRIM